VETPIELMYKAAKQSIPAEAAHVASIANKLQGSLSVLDRQSSLAGDPALLVSMAHVGGDMHAVLSTAVKSMDNCSQALLITANDFVQTDDQARADYNAMDQNLRNAPTPSHSTNELTPPELPGHEVDNTTPIGPPGTTTHVDPTKDPESSTEDQDDRGDGGDNQPGIPEVDREW
jgi:hypothetical protein